MCPACSLTHVVGIPRLVLYLCWAIRPQIATWSTVGPGSVRTTSETISAHWLT